MLAGAADLDVLVGRVAWPDAAVVAPRSAGAVAPLPGWSAVLADTASRTPGCPCCAVRIDLVEAVERAVTRRNRPDHVIVAVDLDDPLGSDVVTAVYTVLSDPDLARLVRLDGVVVAVDPVAVATRLAIGAPPLRPAEVEALAIADRVMVGRADAVTGDAATLIDTIMHAAAPFASVLVPALVPVRRPDVFGIDAWHGVPRHRPLLPVEVPGLELPDTVVLRHNGALEPDAVDGFFDRLVAGNARRLLRFQGLIAATGNDGRTCCHGVRSYAMSHPAIEDGDAGPDNIVVVTGWGLDVDEVADDFRAAST